MMVACLTALAGITRLAEGYFRCGPFGTEGKNMMAAVVTLIPPAVPGNLINIMRNHID